MTNNYYLASLNYMFFLGILPLLQVKQQLFKVELTRKPHRYTVRTYCLNSSRQVVVISIGMKLPGTSLEVSSIEVFVGR